jgi:hypothetical protein
METVKEFDSIYRLGIEVRNIYFANTKLQHYYLQAYHEVPCYRLNIVYRRS